jgi:FkbM family methyltransferase
VAVNPSFQSIFFRLYRWAVAVGLMSIPGGRRLYEASYTAYKRAFETGHLEHLRTYVRPGTTVIDVGANIGFFTVLFADWVDGDGRVIALEPEGTNYARLKKAVARKGLGERVETELAAAAEASGSSHLALNPHHPGDHRLAEDGMPVMVLSLDDLLAKRGWPEVSLIKIDVQGAEQRVIEGARETIARFHPALFVEVDDGALRAMDSDAESLLAGLDGLGYRIHRLESGALSPPMTPATASGMLSAARPYLDFLLVHGNAAPAA